MASHTTGYNFKTGGNTFSGNQLTKAEFGIDGRPDGRGVQPHNYDLPSGLGVNSTTFGGSPYRINNSNNGFKPYQPFNNGGYNNIPTIPPPSEQDVNNSLDSLMGRSRYVLKDQNGNTLQDKWLEFKQVAGLSPEEQQRLRADSKRIENEANANIRSSSGKKANLYSKNLTWSSSGKKANLYSKNLTWQDWLNKGMLN